MKGILFVEFLDLAEKKYGLGVVQEIIDNAELASKGVYTAVGTYNHREFFQILDQVATIESIHREDVLQSFGEHFLLVLSRSYPDFFNKTEVFEFLKSIDDYIHPTVLKLYPDAQLPSFESEVLNQKEMKLIYRSSRKMARFAKGLIVASGEYFGDKLTVELSQIIDDGAEVELTIMKDEQ
jgi:hypothetical protein